MLRLLITNNKGTTMKKYTISITGITPYMQHRMDDATLAEWEQRHNPVITANKSADPDSTRALFHSYIDNEGNFFIPSEHIRGAMIIAGTYVKSKVGAQTKSMKSTVAGMFFIKEEKVYMPPFQEVDKRSAVNKNIKARVIVVRPRWNVWDAKFTLLVDNDTIAQSMIEDIVTYAGNNVGIGSYRPTNNGMYGRFKVNAIEMLTE